LENVGWTEANVAPASPVGVGAGLEVELGAPEAGGSMFEAESEDEQPTTSKTVPEIKGSKRFIGSYDTPIQQLRVKMKQMHFTTALVRPPSTTFAHGLTQSDLGAPNLAKALKQHSAYVAWLRSRGIEVHELPPDDRYPDSTFIEDAALIIDGKVLWTRPGAESRRQEPEALRTECCLDLPSSGVRLEQLGTIEAPGTLDGGDVLFLGDRCMVGLSERTNAEGIRQLGHVLEGLGIGVEAVALPPSCLHLKSGLSDLGDGAVLAIPELAEIPTLSAMNVLVVPVGEEYAANCLRVGDTVLLPARFPLTFDLLTRRGFQVDALDVTEFRKMDGGLSCLSLRF